MESVFTYVFSGIFSLVFFALIYVAYRGFEGDSMVTFGSHVMATICVALGLFCASPIVYEYPSLFEDSIVLEKTQDGRFIEYPHGVFCIEGDSRFITVPSKSNEIQVYSGAYHCKKDQKPELFLQASGQVTVVDYHKLFSRTDDLKTTFKDVTDLNNAINKIADGYFNQVADDSPELEGLCNYRSATDQEAFRTFIEQRINPLLATRGLKYTVDNFWL